MSGTQKDWLKNTDLGLSYEEAAHGVQTSIAMGFYENGMVPKHMRTGIDMQKSDTLGMVCLLVDKGIITQDEYLEYMRLAANRELATREADNPGVFFR